MRGGHPARIRLFPDPDDRTRRRPHPRAGGAGRPHRLAARRCTGAFEIVDDAQRVPSPGIPAGTETTHSRVLLELAEGGTQCVAPRHPPDADPAAGFVSVLGPLGLALIGRSVEGTVRWTRPNRATAHARIASILFQTEASCDHSP